MISYLLELTSDIKMGQVFILKPVRELVMKS